MIWLPREWACSMISLALARASLITALTFSCACARSRWLRSADAKPSAMRFCRSSMAASSGGQMNFIVSPMSSAKQIGRAHVGTPITNAHLVFRLHREEKNALDETVADVLGA